MTSRHAAWLLLALWSCATGSPATRQPSQEEAGLPFVEDDSAAALREAREKHLPLFVETWAPWCRACRSMRATVLTDPALRPYAGRFVWLAINTDLSANEAFLQRYPVDVWPTVLVLDPERELVVARSLGAVSVPQLVTFLEQSERAFRQEPGLSRDLAGADPLAVLGADVAAVPTYQRELAKLPEGHPLRANTVVSLLKSLSTTGAADACVRMTAEELPRLSRTDDRARVLYVGIGCALDTESEASTALRPRLAEAAARDLRAPEDALRADTRSALYESLYELRGALGDEAGARALAEEWLGFLEESTRRARNAEERAVFDTHRMRVALDLEQPERAIPALERSERELPQDYNPPARLAELYLAAGQLERALQASERALALVQGPARGTVVAGHARVLLARGERGRAERLLTEVLKELEGVPEGPGTRLPRRMLQRTLDLVRAQAP